MKTTEMIQQALLATDLMDYLAKKGIDPYHSIIACERAITLLIEVEIKEEFRRDVFLRLSRRFLDRSKRWKKESDDERSDNKE